MRPYNEAATNLVRERMNLCGNPTGSRVSIVWMQAAVVSAPAPHAAAADANAMNIITPTESKWLSLQLGGAELQSPKVCFSQSYPGASSSSTFLETFFADCMRAQNDGYLQLLTIIRLTTGRKLVLNTRETGVTGQPTKERFAGLFEVTSQRSLSLDQRQATEYLADSTGLKFGLAGNGHSDIFVSGDMRSVDCHHAAMTLGRYECERNASACDLGNLCGTDANPRANHVGIVEMQGWLVPRVQHDTILSDSEKSWLSQQLDGADLSEPRVCYNKEADPWAPRRSMNFLSQCAHLVDADEWLVTVAVLSTGRKVVGRTKVGFNVRSDGYFRDGGALHVSPVHEFTHSSRFTLTELRNSIPQ